MQLVTNGLRLAAPYQRTQAAALPAGTPAESVGTSAEHPGIYRNLMHKANEAAWHVQQHRPLVAFGVMLASVIATSLTGDPAFMLCGAATAQGVSQM